MVKIGLLSDTHAWWDDRYEKYFAECDEIWHAGDIGSVELADRFEALKPFRAVYGNIDGHELRLRYPLHQRFTIEGAAVWIHTPSQTIHLGAFAYFESSLRQDSSMPAYQPGSSRAVWIPQKTHAGKLRHRPRRI